MGAHGCRSIEDEDQILLLEHRGARREQRLRPKQREDNSRSRDDRQDEHARFAQPARPPGQSGEPGRDRKRSTHASHVAVTESPERDREREDLPPRQIVETEKPHHAWGGTTRPALTASRSAREDAGAASAVS